MKLSKQNLLLAGTIVLVVAAAGWLFFTGGGSDGKTALVKRGKLEALVAGRGEVNGEKSIKIDLPEALKDDQLRVWSYKISDLIQEGKIVRKGEFIAQLDQSNLMNNMRERVTEKERVDADLKNAVIDSTVILTARREEITNALLELEYKQIDLDMSKYESGAQQRKAQMAWQKAKIDLDKKKRDFQLEQNRLKVQIGRYEDNAQRLQNILDKYQKALAAVRITSPGDGIVMIGQDFLGKKLTKDSNISTWRGELANLPDMSSAIVETYIKEIDITKIGLDYPVRIVVDALPEQVFTGKVIQIANMGEDKSGFDMKVFKVIIRFDHADSELKPGMTCNNDIVVQSSEDALLVPLKAVFSDGKSKFVYLKKGTQVVRSEVDFGAEDEQHIIVVKGLEEGDRVLLYKPESEQAGG
ncbi:efflux RND transporter periplasmic adaptor subunit [Gaoshiqia sp. Z1-71]|uniref:efflux RND transporter periplasmic adaptor subunit n=1 Tax=Gaoshiqia hydrogeniformans TaxID=3290090 RepID=UPI003BF8517E